MSPTAVPLICFFAGPLRWRLAGALFFAGALAALAMPPVFAWPVLFISVPALALALHAWNIDRVSKPLSQKLRHAFGCGWWFGFGYFVAGLYWLAFPLLVEPEKFAILLPLAVTVLPAGLAVFFGLGALASGVAGASLPGRLFLLSAGLAGSEWLRCWVLTGFPWNLFGTALAPPGPLIQATGLVGPIGLTALAVLVGSAPLYFLKSRRAGISALALAGAVLAGLTGYGLNRTSAQGDAQSNGPVLRLVQPNITQQDKLDKAKIVENLDRLIDGSQRNGEGRFDHGAGASHVIWPESVFRFIITEEPEALARLAGLINANQWLVTGAMRLDRGDGRRGQFRIWNSIMVFDQDARRNAFYDKVHLVPFGEYLPLQSLLERIGLEQLTRIRGGFAAGSSGQSFGISGLGPVLPLVCYEVIFPFAVSALLNGNEMAAQKPTWILNLTNDAWFGTSSGPYQHLHQARLRAVETGLPVVRVANTGVTALIDGGGEIVASLPLNTAGQLDVRLPTIRSIPPFGRHPILISLGIILGCLGCGIISLMRQI